MRIFKENDTLVMGLLIGASFPILGYYLIDLLFNFLTSQGLMDSVTQSSAGKRGRTLLLMGICSNIIPIQIMNSNRINNVLKGILIATFIYSGVWLVYYGKNLL
jgi:hypothetical protein